MQIDAGKYHGTEISEIPSDYLEWAMIHLAMSEETRQAVTAEYSRRTHAEAVEKETSAQRLAERIGEAVTKFAAKHGM